ncbi:MAG: transposase [Candidatus Eremiobacteraeota bacterium]|nr:transposase [Candidatus Eremiobacteraeota bacterium]
MLRPPTHPLGLALRQLRPHRKAGLRQIQGRTIIALNGLGHRTEAVRRGLRQYPSTALVLPNPWTAPHPWTAPQAAIFHERILEEHEAHQQPAIAQLQICGPKVVLVRHTQRDDLLNEHVFPTIFHARAAIEAWRIDYNHRPHTSLAGLTPAEFIEQHLDISNSRSLVA